ncbi:hypothetical protein B0H10DRAFT_2216468 [Mycena sp. CBHHK59/15]|nr:hypothetical protein B0H10DRAFT_2216468 [Mycena sp. CBHHK59/15]
MSFLSGSLSSTKWDADLPMSTRPQKSKRRHPVPFNPSAPSIQVQLPIPVTQNDRSSNHKRSRFASTWASLKKYVKRTVAAPYVPSSSLLVENLVSDLICAAPKNTEQCSLGDEVDEVVVDRSWSEDFETESNSDAAETASSTHRTATDWVSVDGRNETSGLFSFVRSRMWSILREFYMPRFEPEEEQLYQKEVWGQTKRLTLWSSVFFIANCALAIISIQDPVVTADKIFFYGISPILAVPILFMCAYNFPWKYPLLFQTFLVASTWSWPIYETLFAFLCGFYAPNDRLFTCGSKDFLSTFYYTSALQAVALFGTSLKRLPASIGAIAFLILTCATIVPARTGYIRNVVSFVIFECVLLYIHSQKEQSSRKLYSLRMQLRLQFARTRRAQINERQAADSKRRLTSYVFHDKFVVRVPLNTALLAVQNMASRPIAKDHEVEFSALEGSLSMMSKVLNDVLDFNRMDSGQLESLSRPYAFHKVLRSLFIPLRLAADARQLEFVTDLDMKIDEVARRAAYQSMKAPPEVIAQHLRDQPSGETVMGMVVGDETRLRQIITNLASNACKFTPAGGKLTIRTRLVLPNLSSNASTSSLHPPTVASDRPSLTATHLNMHNDNSPPDNLASDKPPPLIERIVVRIEVSDTGSGIPPKDMVECKLFSAFNQTEQGRQQGGKGTGLGLALVRQIVKLTGGRLGLRSKVGEGSTFWVELPLGVGRKAMVSPGPPTPSSVGHTLPVLAGHPGSSVSGSSVAEAVDAAAMIAAQSSPHQRDRRPRCTDSWTRVRRAFFLPCGPMYSLSNAGGRFELMLTKYDSHSPVPTRTLGDASTGTEYPLVSSLPPSTERPEYSEPPPLEPQDDSGETVPAVPKPTQSGARPTYVPLPSPRSFALDNHTPSPSPPLPSAAPARLRALVVDDDALTRRLMTRMLERWGAPSRRRRTGRSRCSASWGCTRPRRRRREPRFAVIFLDNQMPKLSGVKLVARLRELGRTDFVVGVTGNALLTDQKASQDFHSLWYSPASLTACVPFQEYLDAGADHVLTKPVLEASLRSMLALAEARTRPSQAEVVP